MPAMKKTIRKTQFNIPYQVYFSRLVESMAAGDTLLGVSKDLYTGLLKAWVFGVVIATVGCSNGLRAKGGALGVGQATRTAVISSFLLIIIIGYYMTWIFYR